MTRPFPFHWMVNAANAKHVVSIFEKLGFTFDTKKSMELVSNELSRAYGMGSKEVSLERVYVCGLPNDRVKTAVIESVAEKTNVELMNSMTVSVDDVEASLDLARKAGMTTKEAQYRRLPIFGNVLVGTAYVEPDSGPVEFCCFTNRS